MPDWNSDHSYIPVRWGVSEPHPSRFLGQRHFPRAVHLHRSSLICASLTSYNCFRLAQDHWESVYIPVMMQVYLNPTPQGFWDSDTHPGLSTYIDHSLTPLLLITVTDWHWPLHGTETPSSECLSLTLMQVGFNTPASSLECSWTPPLKVSGTETLSQGCPPT